MFLYLDLSSREVRVWKRQFCCYSDYHFLCYYFAIWFKESSRLSRVVSKQQKQEQNSKQPVGIICEIICNWHNLYRNTKKTSNSQSNLEKEERNWRNKPAWLQALLQSHSHQDSMVPAQKQKYRSTEQNRKPRDKSTHLWTPYLWQRRQEYTMD